MDKAYQGTSYIGATDCELDVLSNNTEMLNVMESKIRLL